MSELGRYEQGAPLNRADDYQRAAIHESVHVIANEAAGMRNGNVMVMRPCTGQVGLAANSEFGSDEDQITAFVAGEEAERLFGFLDPGIGSHRDETGAKRFAASHLRATSRFEDGATWLDFKAINSVVARGHERAAALVAERKQEIAAFAETLMANNGRLAGDEIDEAIRCASNGWPTPLFDAAHRYQLIVNRRDIFESMVRPAMTPEELSAAWEAADEAARTGRMPASHQPKPAVQIVSGTAEYLAARARQAARLYRAGFQPPELAGLRGGPQE